MLFNYHNMQRYEFKCIHCQSTKVSALINDGGSVQMCNQCNKTYIATVIHDQAMIAAMDTSRLATLKDGTKAWYKDGKCHRDNDLPAKEYKDGTKAWYNEW